MKDDSIKKMSLRFSESDAAMMEKLSEITGETYKTKALLRVGYEHIRLLKDKKELDDKYYKLRDKYIDLGDAVKQKLEADNKMLALVQ